MDETKTSKKEGIEESVNLTKKERAKICEFLDKKLLLVFRNGRLFRHTKKCSAKEILSKSEAIEKFKKKANDFKLDSGKPISAIGTNEWNIIFDQMLKIARSKADSYPGFSDWSIDFHTDDGLYYITSKTTNDVSTIYNFERIKEYIDVSALPKCPGFNFNEIREILYDVFRNEKVKYYDTFVSSLARFDLMTMKQMYQMLVTSWSCWLCSILPSNCDDLNDHTDDSSVFDEYNDANSTSENGNSETNEYDGSDDQEKKPKIIFESDQLEFLKSFLNRNFELDKGFTLQLSSVYELYVKSFEELKGGKKKPLRISHLQVYMKELGYECDSKGKKAKYFSGLKLKDGTKSSNKNH